MGVTSRAGQPWAHNRRPPCDLAIDQSNPGALSFEENGASEEPQSPPAREMLGNYSYNDM